MQYPGDDFSRWSQMLCLLPSHSILCQALVPAHSQYLVLLLTITHSSPACQAASIVLLREPAELLISSHTFYISTYLFRQTVWIHYLPPLIWCPLLGSNKSFSTREGKPGAKGNHSTGSTLTNQSTVAQDIK